MRRKKKKISCLSPLLISLFLIGACSPTSEKNTPWSVLPTINNSGGARQSMRLLLAERSSPPLDLSDRIQFVLPSLPFDLEVRTTCRKMGAEGSVQANWTGRMAPDVELPVLQLIPRQIIFERGQSSIAETTCNFDFRARSDQGDVHQFALQNRTLQVNGPVETPLPVVTQEPKLNSRTQPYELRCANFNWRFHRQPSASESIPEFSKWVEETIDAREPLLRLPRQSCRLFHLRGEATLAMSPLLRLQFTPPNLEIRPIAIPSESEINNLTTNPWHFQGRLARYLLHNKNPFPLRVRLPHSPTSGVSVLTLLPNLLNPSPRPTYASMFDGQIGYTTITGPEASAVREGDKLYLNLSPWERTAIEVVTSFSFHCPERQYLARLSFPQELVLGYVPVEDQAPRNEVLPDFRWNLETSGQHWISNYRVPEKPLASDIPRRRYDRCSVRSSLR